MSRDFGITQRQRLVTHVQDLERLESLKALASENLKDAFDRAESQGYDVSTLRVVLKLRRMTPHQRRERRALEAIYMAELGMLEGEALPDDARRRLDGDVDDARAGEPPPPPDGDAPDHGLAPRELPELPPPAQPPLVLKTPEEARAEGAEAAATGQRIYDNPYSAGDPCRAAWDEGWCGQQKSHGMDTPSLYQRRATKTEKSEKRDEDGDGDLQKGAA